jgi:hypothetical protein
MNTVRRDGQNIRRTLKKMKHRNFLLPALVIALAFGIFFAGCGNKDPLEGKWTTTVDGDTITFIFYGGQVGLDGLGNDMTPYTFEKNVGTIDTGYGGITFTLDGKTIKTNILGMNFTLTRDTTTPTPKALAGEWIADAGDRMVFISDLVIATDEDGDMEFGSYTFADNKGEVAYTPFIVDGKTLTLDPEYEDYKIVYTLGGKK